PHRRLRDLPSIRLLHRLPRERAPALALSRHRLRAPRPRPPGPQQPQELHGLPCGRERLQPMPPARQDGAMSRAGILLALLPLARAGAAADPAGPIDLTVRRLPLTVPASLAMRR